MSEGPSDRREDREDSSERERYLGRRRFMMATGSLTGVGILAKNALGGKEQSSQQGTPTPTPTPTPTEEGQPGQDVRTTPVRLLEGVSIQDRFPGLEILAEEPLNAQAELRETYTDFITPEKELYVRNHYPTPEIDASEWTVSLTGLAGQQNVELSMDEIEHGFSTETIAHAMQCSGNGRAYFDPSVGGNQWTFGAVGNDVWTGTPVSEILEQYGADTSRGRYLSVMGGDAPEGSDIFTRSIPMRKVMQDCILAYEVNGEPMLPEHGYPVRLVVPGWFGNNNVKWVERMHVMDTMVYGQEWQQYTHWQQGSYRIVPAGEEPNRQPDIDVFDTQEQMANEAIRHPYMYDQMVKSLIGYPPLDSTVSPGLDGQIEVLGVAWAGDDDVQSVSVSTDGGQTWNEAEFFGPSPGPASWRQWRYKWDASPGEYTLVSRATDAQGRNQPATISRPEEGLIEIRNNKYPWNKGGYGATAYMPMAVNVTVEEGDGTPTPTGTVTETPTDTPAEPGTETGTPTN